MYDLKNIFELRHIKSLSRRVSTGRVFYQDNQMGLCDAGARLFPVVLGVDPRFRADDRIDRRDDILKPGDVIVFECLFEDGVFFIQKILNHVPCLQDWKNSVIPNPILSHKETKKRFDLIQKRNQALLRTRQFFENRGFVHMETPTLVPSGGMETYLHPFQTTYQDHRGQAWHLEMPTSPEFALKKILTEGVTKIFQLSRAYRNCGELSKHHEPEFIMLEWYRTHASLGDMLGDTRKLVIALAEFLGSDLDIPLSWPTFRVDQLFSDLMGLKLDQLQDPAVFYKKAKPHSVSLVETDDWDSIFCKLFMEKVEPYLKSQKACFVTHYPIQMGALAAQEKGKPYVERAEAFLYGVEICNAYLELVDAKNFQQRLEKTKSQVSNLAQDPLFENAMAFGLPPCAGNALGIDRVIALLLGQKSISSLYPIPFLSQFLKNTVAEE